jgi:hypothetical protein
MWLASIVEHSDDVIRKNLHGIITSWDKGASLAIWAIGKRLTIWRRGSVSMRMT